MRLFFQLAMISTVVCVGSWAQSAKALNCGRLENHRGKVEILRVKKGHENKQDPVRNAMRAKKRQKLSCRDVILTRDKSRAKVRLKGNKVLTMGPHSRISIEEYAKKTGDPTLLHLTYGKVRALFNEEKEEKKKAKKEELKQSRFRIRTSTAVAGVRGTDFFVSFEPNTQVTEQATISGKVEVEQVGTGQKVDVPAGNKVAVEQAPQAAPSQQMVAKGKKLDGSSGSGLVKSAKVVTTPVIIKKLEVKPIDSQLVADIRQTSVLVKADKEFTSKEAVKLLGGSEDWKPPAEELPFDLKDVKEEF